MVLDVAMIGGNNCLFATKIYTHIDHNILVCVDMAGLAEGARDASFDSDLEDPVETSLDETLEIRSLLF